MLDIYDKIKNKYVDQNLFTHMFFTRPLHNLDSPYTAQQIDGYSQSKLS